MAGTFLSVAWPTRVQLLAFFCSSVPVVLFDTPGISKCRSQHVVSVESSTSFHHSIYLWFICFSWWSIDELENLEPWQKLKSSLGSRKTGLSPPPRSILRLTVPRRYFCCGSLLLLVLAARIYIIWFTYYVSDHLSGKELFIRFTARAFRKRNLVISLFVLRAGYGIWLYQSLIIAYIFLLYISTSNVLKYLPDAKTFESKKKKKKKMQWSKV